MIQSIKLISSAVLLLAALISYLMLKHIQKEHKKDPVFMEEQRKREAAYKEKIEQENRSLQEYVFSDEEYSDDEEI